MNESLRPQNKRLLSIDALRGLDMLVIIGAAGLVRHLHQVQGGTILTALAEQLEHAAWHGFRFYDLIFPLFLFLSGASLPFSLERRAQAGEPRGPLVRGACKRALILVALGILYNGALRLDGEPLRYASVLGRIGLAWLGAALAVVYLSKKSQTYLIAGLLLGYWALMVIVSVPGWGAGDWSPGHNLTDWVDQQLLPGRLHNGDRDPEGILGTFPAIATALLGACAGRCLLTGNDNHRRRAIKLIVMGAIGIGLGLLWHLAFPINKNLWTSSFALLCAGISAGLLGIASYCLDGPKRPGWIAPLLVIGANPIAAYLLHRFVDFEGMAQALCLPNRVHTLVGALVLQWLLLVWLAHKKWFLRV